MDQLHQAEKIMSLSDIDVAVLVKMLLSHPVFTFDTTGGAAPVRSGGSRRGGSRSSNETQPTSRSGVCRFDNLLCENNSTLATGTRRLTSSLKTRRPPKTLSRIGGLKSARKERAGGRSPPRSDATRNYPKSLMRRTSMMTVSDLLKSIGETPKTLAPMLDWRCGHLFLCEKAKGPNFFPNLGKGDQKLNKHEDAKYPLRVIATVMRLNAATTRHLSAIAQNFAGFLIQIIEEKLHYHRRKLGQTNQESASSGPTRGHLDDVHVDDLKQKLRLGQSYLRKLVKKLSSSAFSWSWILSAFSIALDESRIWRARSGSAYTRYGLAAVSVVRACVEIRISGRTPAQLREVPFFFFCRSTKCPSGQSQCIV